MTRKTAREIAIRLSFAHRAPDESIDEIIDRFFAPEHYESLAEEDELFAEKVSGKQLDYIRRLVKLTQENVSELDGFIERYARGWKADRISRTARAILRTALCEILYMEDIPDSAAISEAVELDKSYDTQETVAFVNGVLGGFMRGEKGVELPESKTEQNEETAAEEA